MEYLFIALGGWVGGGAAVSLGAGYPRDDGDPWPPWPPCLACGGLLGLLAALVLPVVFPVLLASDGAARSGGAEHAAALAVAGLTVGAAVGLAFRIGAAALRRGGRASG